MNTQMLRDLLVWGVELMSAGAEWERSGRWLSGRGLGGGCLVVGEHTLVWGVRDLLV